VLPKLPDTDVLQTPPDVTGIDITSPAFTRSALPPGPGVYCFYDPVTNEPIYIGSGCSLTGHNPAGLWLRLKWYRKPRKHDRKAAVILELAKERKVLLKAWLTASGGDALKYESDAIIKYRPRLNRNGTMTREQAREKIRVRNRASGERRKRRYTYEPEEKRICTACGRARKCKLFSRHPRMRFGVYSICKECHAKQEEQRRAARRLIRVDGAVS